MDAADLIVVAVLVGDQHQVSGFVISLSGEGVDVDDSAVFARQPVAAMSLIQKFCHRKTSFKF